MKLLFSLRKNPRNGHPTLLARVCWAGEKVTIDLPFYIPSAVNWKQSPRVIVYADLVQRQLRQIVARLGDGARPALVKAVFLCTQDNPRLLELLDAFIEARLSEASEVVRNHLQDFLEVRGATEIPVASFYHEWMGDFEDFIAQFGMSGETSRQMTCLRKFLDEVRRLRCDCETRENSRKAL
jgi:hypothetical protein